MNKKLFIRLTSAMLCTMMLFTGVVSALGEGGLSVLALPQKLDTIEREAFAGTEGLEKVIVQDGTKRIESRAFANSGIREIYLPDSVEYIADDAFEGCDDLTATVERGSDAHEWFAFSGKDYVIAGETPEEGMAVYSISGLEVVPDAVSGRVFRAVIQTAQACTLRITCTPEGSDKAVVTECDLEGDMNGEVYTCEPSAALPASYMMEACLYDDAGNPLCAPVISRRYTSAYTDFMNQTAADFPEARVMDFGDAGYAVLEENVARVAGVQDMGGGRYTYTPVSVFAGGETAVPRVGDVLMMNVGGTETPVKVGSVSINDDGSVTVAADKEISLSEVYSTLKLDGYINASDDSVSGSAQGEINFNKPFGEGAFTANVNCNMSIRVTAEYDKINFGKDYFGFAMSVRNWGSGNATLTGSFSTDDLKKPIDIILYSGIVIIPGLNLPATMVVSLPVFASAGGSGTFDFQYDKTIGFSWNSDSGFASEPDSGVNNAEAEIQVNFDANIGPKVDLSVGIYDFVEASIHGKVGLGLEGTVEARAHIGDEVLDEEEKHACNLCLDLDVYVFAEAGASIKYDISEKTKGSLLDETISTPRFKVVEKFCSYINEEDSDFGGERTKGDGNCTNYKFPVEITTQDMNGNTLKGLAVTVTDGGSRTYTQKSPFKRYLYDGTYTASAPFASGTFSEKFSVVGNCVSMVLKERETVIEGTVSNNTTGAPLKDVTVKLVKPDGKSVTKTTGADGNYRFDKLPGGKFTLTFTKKGYNTVGPLEAEYKGGTVNRYNVGMVGESLPTLKARLQWGNYKTETATNSEGKTAPQKITIEPVKSGTSLSGFRLKNSTMDQSYSYSWTNYRDLLMSVGLDAVDVGDGTYTYLLTLYFDNPHARCFVLREENGKLAIVLDFTYLGSTDSIYGTDKENDGFVDYNNVSASSGNLGIRDCRGKVVTNSQGINNLDIIVEEADFNGSSEGAPYLEVTTTYSLVNGKLTMIAQKVD